MQSTICSHLTILFILPLFIACNDSYQESQNAMLAEELQVEEPTSRNDQELMVIASGTLKPVGEVEVGSEVSGTIIELLVDFNDVVQKGQPIAKIDPKFFEAQIRQAEAALLNAEALVEMKKASLRQAVRSLKRIRALNKRKAVSENSLEEAETNVWVIEAELEQAKAVVISHEAALEEAKVTLSRTEILAPIDGVVLSREVMSGQTVAASLEAPRLFKLAHTLDEMEIHARIDEADIGQIRTGQSAEFSVPAYGNQRFKAKVEQIRVAPLVFDNVVTYTVVLSVENNGDPLLPGMTAVVEITTDETPDTSNASYTSRIEESMTSKLDMLNDN